MENIREMLIEAIEKKDLLLVEKMLTEGANINAQDEYSDSVLKKVVFILQEDAERHDVIKFLLDKGADPNLLDDEGGSPMYQPMFNMDTEMLELLLDYGADPNAAAGLAKSETFYDSAEFDYRYNVYDLYMPEDPTDFDKLNEDNWLNFLQRLAEKYNVRQPDHLYLLRRRGAKAVSELKDNT